MPTGYTAPIIENEDYTFERYVWDCARAFGALMYMRDDKHDVKIYKPASSDYYKLDLEKANADLELFTGMSEEELKEYIAKSRKDDELRYLKAVKKWEVENLRLTTMRERVERWDPPTADHVDLKRFMLEQIQQTIALKPRRDCYISNRIDDPEEFRRDRIEFCERRILAREASIDDDIRHASDRWKWIGDLDASVRCPDEIRWNEEE